MAAHSFWRRRLSAVLLSLAGLPAGVLASDEQRLHIDDAGESEPAAVEFQTASFPAYGAYDVAGNYSQSFFQPESSEDDCCPRWSFLFTQTADYGTSLALPISLTPANTLVGPLGGVGQILDLQLLSDLGLLDNLGLIPGPVPDVPAVAVFDDDFQFQTLANLTRTSRVGDSGTFAAGYTYYQSLHPDLKPLDLYSHTATLQYAQQLTDYRLVGGDYNYSYYFLDGNSFVSQNRLGAFWLERLSDRWATHVRGDYFDANFRTSEFLNSDNYAARLEAIRYLAGDPNDYLTFGYGAGYSDAVARPFSYQVNSLYVGGRWLYGECDQNDLRLTLAYGIYDFFGVDPVQPVERQDEIATFNIWHGRQFAENLQWFAAYTYLHSNSNVVRNDYDSSLISLGITYFR